jgi:hypothetical protein
MSQHHSNDGIIYSQEIMNGNTYNTAEDIALQILMMENQLTIIEGLAQGDCFFDTIIQFVIRYQQQPSLSPILQNLPSGTKKEQISYLRNVLVNYMNEHIHDEKYHNHFDEEQISTIELLRNLKEYLCAAGDLILHFASDAFGINIVCYNVMHNMSKNKETIQIMKVSYSSEHPEYFPTVTMLRTSDHYRLLWPTGLAHPPLPKKSSKKANVLNYESNENKGNALMKNEENGATMQMKMNKYTTKMLKKYGNNMNMALQEINKEQRIQNQWLRNRTQKRRNAIATKSSTRNAQMRNLQRVAQERAQLSKIAHHAYLSTAMQQKNTSSKLAKQKENNIATAELIAQLELGNKKAPTKKKKTLLNLQHDLEAAYLEMDNVEQTKRSAKVWTKNDESAYQRQIKDIERVIVRIGERMEKRVSGGNRTKKNKK